MANHQPTQDNYVQKKTWDEAAQDVPGSTPSEDEKAKDAAKRSKDKGEAAKNGGGAGK